MSHELRTPLNSVIAFNGLLLQSDIEDGHKAYVKSAMTSAEALLGVINNILEYAKFQKSDVSLDRSECEVATIFDDLIDIVSSKASSKNIDFCVEVDPKCPSKITTDSFRLRQVFINLVDNAIKFTPSRAGVTLRVTVISADRQSVKIHFSVIDEGIGIPEDKLHLLFRAFSQVISTSTRAHGGTGLGLLISQRIIEAMGGRIEVSSKLNVGTTFQFTLTFPLGKDSKPICQAILPPAFPKNLQAAHMVEHERVVESIFRVVKDQVNITWYPLKSNPETDPRLIIIDYHLLSALNYNLYRNARFLVLTSMFDINPLAHPISEAMKGRVEFMTKPLKLTNFLARIAALSASPAEQQRMKNLNPNKPPGQLIDLPPNFHVLVVEDNPVNVKVAHSILRRIGVTFDTAYNGKEALDKVRQYNYEMVLMDVQMPVMDGLQATSEIRRLEREGVILIHNYIVAMTASASAEDRDRCMNAGMDRYMSKPIYPNALCQLIEERVHQLHGAPSQRKT